MKLFIECNNSAIRDLYDEERTKYNDDSGFDLHCPEDIVINSEGLTSINLGIKCWSPDKVGYMLIPRSSIYKYNIIQANSIGIIDAGYIGNIRANVLHYVNKSSSGVFASNIMLLMTVLLNHMMFSTTAEFAVIGTFIWGFFGTIYVHKKYMNTTIKAGTRLFQLVAFDGKPINVEFVEFLPAEAYCSEHDTRGDNGFGSTDRTDKYDTNSGSDVSDKEPNWDEDIQVDTDTQYENHCFQSKTD